MAGQNNIRRDAAYNPAVLEQRIHAVEKGQADLAEDIHKLGQVLGLQISQLSIKQDERSKPQWSVIIALVGTLLSFGAMIGGMGYLIIRGTTDHLEADIIRLYHTDETQLARVEFDTFRTNNNIAIRDLRESIVQKDQFEARWRQYQDSHKDLQDRVLIIAQRIDQINTRLNMGFTIQDAVKGMIKP